MQTALAPELDLLVQPYRFFSSVSFRMVALAALGTALFFAGYVYWRVSTHNEDVVEAGQLYRSAQLTAPELQDEISTNGIRTVINLRGENKTSLWYQKELALCDQDGVRHIDVHLSGKHLPTPVEMDKLLDALQTAPRPILVHCLSGSDRTGLAATIFLIDQEHVPWKQAEDALSLRFGHFAIHPYFRMDEFIQLYGQSTDPSLNDWIRKVYPSVYAEESHETTWDQMTEPLELLVHGRLD